MADPGIVREWVLKAEEDFEFARISLREKKPFYSHICFLFQQSAEKHLKALSLALGLGLQKTHDLLAILKDALPRSHPSWTLQMTGSC